MFATSCRFQVFYTVTQSTPEWEGYEGRVSMEMLLEILPPPPSAGTERELFIGVCGPDAFTHHIVRWAVYKRQENAIFFCSSRNLEASKRKSVLVKIGLKEDPCFVLTFLKEWNTLVPLWNIFFCFYCAQKMIFEWQFYQKSVFQVIFCLVWLFTLVLLFHTIRN